MVTVSDTVVLRYRTGPNLNSWLTVYMVRNMFDEIFELRNALPWGKEQYGDKFPTGYKELYG